MRILPFRRDAGRPTVGVAFATDRVALAAVRPGGRDALPVLVQCGQLPLAADAGGSRAERLRAWVDEAGVEGARAVGVLAAAEYQVLQIEAPPVPATEMAQAAAWRVRELVDLPLDQAVVDTFDFPESAQRGQRHVNVVVAQSALVGERIEQLHGAGLRPDAIDIPDLAQRNVSDRLPAVRGGHALLALDQGGGLITVYRDGELFLARSLDTGLAELASDRASAAEALVLEVQRSLDYFESALSQPPLGGLYVFPPEEPVDDALIAELTGNLSDVEVRTVGLGDLVAVEAEPAHAGATMLHAVGAALREPEAG